MSAAIIAFPDEKARELLLNGCYRLQDVKEGGRLPSAVDRYRERLEREATENKAYHARLASLRAAGVPPRSVWDLALNGAASLADVARLNVVILEKARNVGTKTIRELRNLLLNNGISPDPSWEEWESQQEAREQARQG
ncbi:hypothetical protein AGMMS49587_16570 [Spirochaetia bacterium]|nr:hypothetical protein AGMMS49587_16570 [Spirochaetia bacterium]